MRLSALKSKRTVFLPKYWCVFVSVLLTVSIYVTYVIVDLTADQDPYGRNQNQFGQTLPVTNHCAGTDPSKSLGPPPWRDPGPYHVAYPGNYSFTVDEPHVCETKTPFLVLMVPVAPGNLAARWAIRRTWGGEPRVQGRTVLTLFVLGLPGGPDAEEHRDDVRQESRVYRDLIQCDFLDSYVNLTIKTMLMLEWLSTRCPSASYAMKVDSDIFLNVHNLVRMLLAPDTPRENYVTGLVWRHSPVVRNRHQKFFMPREVVAEPEYPPYPLGLGYVMSNDLPRKILGVSCRVRPVYIEDVYLGMCLNLLGISPSDPPRSDMFHVNPVFALGRCGLSKVVAVTTKDIAQLLWYWETNRKPGRPCWR